MPVVSSPTTPMSRMFSLSGSVSMMLPRYGLEVEQQAVLRVLAEVRVVELHDVGQAASGRLGLALLPELGEAEEGGVDRDVRVLLVERGDRLVVELGAHVVAPEGEVEGDLLVGVVGRGGLLAAAAARAAREHEGRARGDGRCGRRHAALANVEHRCPPGNVSVCLVHVTPWESASPNVAQRGRRVNRMQKIVSIRYRMPRGRPLDSRGTPGHAGFPSSAPSREHTSRSSTTTSGAANTALRRAAAASLEPSSEPSQWGCVK